MALFVIQHVLFDNYDADSGILQGMAVALSTSSAGKPIAVKAYRAASHNYLGLAAGDTTTTGVTMAVVDPVSPGNYSHDSGAGDDPTAYSGPAPVAHPARRLGDYLDERITNVKNWTDVDSNGLATPMRGIAVYKHGGRFETDQYITTASTSSSTADGGAAPTFAVDQSLTFGGPVGNAGKLIVRSSSSDGTEIARIFSTSVSNGMLQIMALL